TLLKDNTGYDLKQLFIGSEGTLGIITGVALKLLPLTRVRSVVLAAVNAPLQALELLRSLYGRCGARLQAYEFFTDECLGLVLEHVDGLQQPFENRQDRKSTRLNSSHVKISYAVFCLKKKK